MTDLDRIEAIDDSGRVGVPEVQRVESIVTDIDAVREYREAKLDPELDAGDIMGYADAAIAELQDKLDRAQEYARIEVKRKNEAVERECAAIERAEKAEAELGELDSYNGHLKWMDKHYPLDVSYFAEGEDVGCQVMRMSRKVMASEAALAKCEQQKRGLASAAKTGMVAGNRVIELEAEAERLKRMLDHSPDA
jgi:hypothetical protein